MSYRYLSVSKDGGIAMIALNRPDKRNAMNGEMIQEMAQALTVIANDAQANVLMIHGNGEHFCAGADIVWMQTIAKAPHEDNLSDAHALAAMLYQLYTFPKPSIVLAHGATLGGGLGLVSACDMAIAARDASFGFSEVKIGIAPSTISPYVISAIGERAARYYFLTGVRFGADEARQAGLIHQVTENDALFRTGHALAQTILLNSPNALREIKHLVRRVAHEPISPEVGRMTAEHLAALRVTPEAQEGLKAFLEKRSPSWSK